MSDEIVSVPAMRKQITASQQEQLCGMVADGMTRTGACKAMGLKPGQLSAWLRKDPEFEAKWKRAQTTQVATLEDECIEIADEACEDMVAVQRNRLRVETRLKVLGRWAPRGMPTTQIQGVVLLPSLDPSKDAKQVGLQEIASFSAGQK